MTQHNTYPAISVAILRNLRKWRKSGGIYGHHYQDNKIASAIKEQKDIGWDHFMLGRIIQRWGNIQLTYYKSMGSKETGERWAEEFIKEIWRIHCAIWNGRNDYMAQVTMWYWERRIMKKK
jgi:hypothetical protein